MEDPSAQSTTQQSQLIAPQPGPRSNTPSLPKLTEDQFTFLREADRMLMDKFRHDTMKLGYLSAVLINHANDRDTLLLRDSTGERVLDELRSLYFELMYNIDKASSTFEKKVDGLVTSGLFENNQIAVEKDNIIRKFGQDWTDHWNTTQYKIYGNPLSGSPNLDESEEEEDSQKADQSDDDDNGKQAFEIATYQLLTEEEVNQLCSSLTLNIAQERETTGRASAADSPWIYSLATKEKVGGVYQSKGDFQELRLNERNTRPIGDVFTSFDEQYDFKTLGEGSSKYLIVFGKVKGKVEKELAVFMPNQQLTPIRVLPWTHGYDNPREIVDQSLRGNVLHSDMRNSCYYVGVEDDNLVIRRISIVNQRPEGTTLAILTIQEARVKASNVKQVFSSISTGVLWVAVMVKKQGTDGEILVFNYDMDSGVNLLQRELNCWNSINNVRIDSLVGVKGSSLTFLVVTKNPTGNTSNVYYFTHPSPHPYTKQENVQNPAGSTLLPVGIFEGVGPLKLVILAANTKFYVYRAQKDTLIPVNTTIDAQMTPLTNCSYHFVQGTQQIGITIVGTGNENKPIIRDLKIPLPT